MLSWTVYIYIYTVQLSILRIYIYIYIYIYCFVCSRSTKYVFMFYQYISKLQKCEMKWHWDKWEYKQIAFSMSCRPPCIYCIGVWHRFEIILVANGDCTSNLENMVLMCYIEAYCLFEENNKSILCIIKYLISFTNKKKNTSWKWHLTPHLWTITEKANH